MVCFQFISQSQGGCLTEGVFIPVWRILFGFVLSIFQSIREKVRKCIIFQGVKNGLKGFFQIPMVKFLHQCLHDRRRFQFIIRPIIPADITQNHPFLSGNQSFQKHVAVSFWNRNISDLTFSHSTSLQRFSDRNRHMPEIQMILAVRCRESSFTHPQEKDYFERNWAHRQVGGKCHPFCQIMPAVDLHSFQLLQEELPCLMK